MRKAFRAHTYHRSARFMQAACGGKQQRARGRVCKRRTCGKRRDLGILREEPERAHVRISERASRDLEERCRTARMRDCRRT